MRRNDLLEYDCCFYFATRDRNGYELFQKIIKVVFTLHGAGLLVIHFSTYVGCMKTIDQAIGERVRVERIEASVTEAAFANALKISRGRLALCEDGQARFSAVELQRVCHLLALRPATIFAAVNS